MDEAVFIDEAPVAVESSARTGAGFLYVCLQPGASFYKMGLTRCVDATVRRYKTTLGLLTLTFFECDDPERAEKELFRHMAAYRVAPPAEVFARWLERATGARASELLALEYLMNAYGPPTRVMTVDSPAFTRYRPATPTPRASLESVPAPSPTPATKTKSNTKGNTKGNTKSNTKGVVSCHCFGGWLRHFRGSRQGDATVIPSSFRVVSAPPASS